MEAWAALKRNSSEPIRIQDQPRTGLGQQLTVQAVVNVKGVVDKWRDFPTKRQSTTHKPKATPLEATIRLRVRCQKDVTVPRLVIAFSHIRTLVHISRNISNLV